MVVGVCRLNLFFPASGSLKTKRQGVRRIVDRLRAKYNVAVAEVGGSDTWQRASLGMSVVSNSAPHAQEMLDELVTFVEDLYVAQILDRQSEVLHFDEEHAPPGGWDA